MDKQTVLVTGGCGYIGCKLVPALLGDGYRVRVLDVLLFGNRLPAEAQASPLLELVVGDIRDDDVVRRSLAGVDAVVHLAALANDPSADLDPELTRQVNYDAVLSLLEAARRAGVSRFVNASTATVYGVRDESDIDEGFEHRPITLYGEYKSKTDAIVREANAPGFTTVCLRSATVCGWSRRMRLDLTVNLLTHQAVERGRITVFGGAQMRPNIVIDDLARAYRLLLEAPVGLIGGQAFNVGAENLRVLEIASLIQQGLGLDTELIVEPVFDHRSYHISSERIRRVLGFTPLYGALDGARQVRDAFLAGEIPEPASSVYRNVEHMKKMGALAAR